MTARCAPTTNPDRMTYLVQCRYKDGLFWAERDVGDTDRATTINHIRSGNLWNVVTVLECNPVEGICRDVTDDMMAEVAKPRDPPSIEESCQKLRNMLASYDHDRDLRKHGVYGW